MAQQNISKNKMHPDEMSVVFLTIILSLSINNTLCYLTSDQSNVNENRTKMCFLNQHFNEPGSEYTGGDYLELFRTANKQSYTLISINNQISQGHDGELNEPCYVCIKYYNVSSENFEIQDKLVLNTREQTSSSHQIWEGRLDKHASSSGKTIFDVGSKSGKINTSYIKCVFQ